MLLWCRIVTSLTRLVFNPSGCVVEDDSEGVLRALPGVGRLQAEEPEALAEGGGAEALVAVGFGPGALALVEVAGEVAVAGGDAAGAFFEPEGDLV